MQHWLDKVFYGEAWATRDAHGERRPLYGPWAWVLSSAERSAFPRQAFARVRSHAAGRRVGLVRLVLLAFGLIWMGGGLMNIVLLPFDVRFGLVETLVPSVIMIIVGMSLVLGVPPEPSRFREAMLAENRCPSCAQALREPKATDGAVSCPECGAAWKLPRI